MEALFEVEKLTKYLKDILDLTDILDRSAKFYSYHKRLNLKYFSLNIVTQSQTDKSLQNELSLKSLLKCKMHKTVTSCGGIIVNF